MLWKNTSVVLKHAYFMSSPCRHVDKFSSSHESLKKNPKPQSAVLELPWAIYSLVVVKQMTPFRILGKCMCLMNLSYNGGGGDTAILVQTPVFILPCIMQELLGHGPSVRTANRF